MPPRPASPRFLFGAMSPTRGLPQSGSSGFCLRPLARRVRGRDLQGERGVSWGLTEDREDGMATASEGRGARARSDPLARSLATNDLLIARAMTFAERRGPAPGRGAGAEVAAARSEQAPSRPSGSRRCAWPFSRAPISGRQAWCSRPAGGPASTRGAPGRPVGRGYQGRPAARDRRRARARRVRVPTILIGGSCSGAMTASMRPPRRTARSSRLSAGRACQRSISSWRGDGFRGAFVSRGLPAWPSGRSPHGCGAVVVHAPIGGRRARPPERAGDDRVEAPAVAVDLDDVSRWMPSSRMCTPTPARFRQSTV